MAKRASAHLTAGEQAAGTALFVIYLLVLPFAAGPMFRILERLLGIPLSQALENVLYYYILFAVTVVIFHGFLARTTRRLAEEAGLALQTLAAGLVALYGLNELVYRLTNLLVDNRTNLNNMAISAQIDDAPHMTLLIVVFLAPFVEEVLFRGYVFGSLRDHSRAVAYVVSCVLFAFLHVWQFAAGDLLNFSRILLLVQYLVPGLVLCWSYDRCGNLWAPILIHMSVNALHVWANW